MASESFEGVVYRIQCSGNGCTYIVSTRKMPSRQRWLEHLHYLRKNKHPSSRMQRCFNKYGESSLNWKVVEEGIDGNVLLAREQFWIWTISPELLLNSVPISDAGICARLKVKGRVVSAEERKRRSEAFHRSVAEGRRKPRVWDEEARAKQSIALTGRKMPPSKPERGQRISAAKKGKRRSAAAIANSVAARLSFIQREIKDWREMRASGMSLRRIEAETGRCRKVIARELSKP